MIGIYKITSPTNKIYVGQSVNIEKRFNDYLLDKTKYKNQIRLVNSINKYGIKNHVFEILEECKFEQLNICERKWQDFYNVIGKQGLNCKLQSCNGKSGKLSEETKNKIRNSNFGKKRNNTVIQNTRLTRHNSLKVLCTKTNKIWISVADCSRNLNIPKHILYKSLNNNNNKTSLIYLNTFLENGK